MEVCGNGTLASVVAGETGVDASLPDTGEAATGVGDADDLRPVHKASSFGTQSNGRKCGEAALTVTYNDSVGFAPRLVNDEIFRTTVRMTITSSNASPTS